MIIMMQMEAKVSLFVKGRNPYNSLKKLLIQNGILKNDFGLKQSVVSQKKLNSSTYLFQLSLYDLQRLQVQQGIPFQSFKGEPAQPFEPKSVLVVSKDTQEPAHLETLTSVQSTLQALGIRHKVVNLRNLNPQHFRNKDLVMPIGGDGTFLRTAHFVQDKTPFVGVVSDPQTADSNPLGSWGHYLLVSAAEVEQAFNLMSQGQFQLEALTRLRAFLINQEKTIEAKFALNEIFINEQDSAHSVRYILKVHGITETMADSGMLVSTGAGSSANSWISNALGLSFAPSSNLLQFKLREPPRFLKDASERVLLHGFADGLEAESAMYHRPRVSIDGSAKHYTFPSGAKIVIRPAPHPLNFAVFPSIATREMAEPERPVAEIGAPKERLNIPPEQIKEIDALPICSTVSLGSKRQILMLMVTRDLDKLHIVRILKSGGVSLSKKDFDIEATVDNPTLLYPTAQIASLPAVARDVVLGLYSYGLRINEYAGTVVEWDSSIDKNVWAPSIDTIAFMRPLRDKGIFGDHIISAAEIGTGNGAIAKATVFNCQNLKELTITDIEKRAIECALRNLRPVLGKIDVQTILGKGIKGVGKVDLLMVNPPYLPEKKVSGEIDQYRGLGLIEEVLREGKEHLNPGGSIVINYSSCAEKEFKRWTKKYGWKVKPLQKITVPLKIVRVYKDPEWLEFMLEHGGLEIRDEVQTGYRYWHTLNIVQLTPA